MPNKVVLSVKYPPLITYSRFTNILSILSSQKNAQTWLLNNHILLWIAKKDFERSYWADFKYNSGDELCPFVKEEIVERKLASQDGFSIIDFVIDNINNGKYLFLNINKYYIDEYWPVGIREHEEHEIFIFGYDRAEASLFVADFFQNKYKYIQIPFSNFAMAYDNFHLTGVQDYLGGIILMKFREADNELDVPRIKNIIQDFLASRDTVIQSAWDMFKIEEMSWGMEFFSTLQQYMEYKVNEKTFIDIRPFHLIYIFSHIMELRIEYLKELGYIGQHESVYDMFVKIRERLLLMRTMIIKYNISNNQKILERQLRELPLIAESIRSALEYLIELI